MHFLHLIGTFFNDNPIRTKVVDGQIWFVGHDVAKALGYAKPRNAVQTHCKLFQKDNMNYALKQGLIKKKSRGTPNIIIIPESDVYRLIIKSKVKSPLFG